MAIFLIRHGSAGRRDDRDPADEHRPLDPDGHRQAAAIAGLLVADAATAAPVTQVLSSPYRRCLETVTPLADALGLAVVAHRDLTEGTDVERSWAVAEGLASAGVTAALCSHGDVIPDIVRRAQTRGMVVTGRAGCAKGSVWTLHWDGERFDRGAYTTT